MAVKQAVQKCEPFVKKKRQFKVNIILVVILVININNNNHWTLWWDKSKMWTERLTYVQKDHQKQGASCLHKFKPKPYLFQSESKNPETVIREEKSSSLGTKGWRFVVGFHKKR